ncbi:hypothetical protein [Pseudoxanthomonas beigongshangi]|jgi:hypothetical protein
MSAPDFASSGVGYFADYEVYVMGEAVAWGQITLACANDDGERDPVGLIRRLRQAAADQHGAEAGAIRLRQVCRL